MPAGLAVPDMELSGTWRAAIADDELRRTFPDRSRRRRLGAGVAGPRPLAVDAGVRRRRRAPAATAPVRGRPAGAPAGGPGWCSTASSTRATCGSTAPTSATPRATSSPTRSRSPSRSPAHRARARRRGDVRPPDRPHGQAQHHRRVPALGLPRPRLEPRRHLAAGAGRARPARCASAACGCCAARPTPSGPSSSLRAVPRHRRRRRTVTAAHHRRRRVEPTSSSSRSPPARTRSSGPVAVDRPRPVVAARPRRRSRSTTSHVEVAPRRRSRASDRATAPHRAAPGRDAATGCCRSTASGCSSRAPTRARPRMALGRGDARRARSATCASPRTPASTCCASTPTSAGPSSTTPPTSRHAALAGPAAAVGLRPRRPQAGGPPGPRGGRPARPPPVDRDLVRPQRADRDRRRAGDAADDPAAGALAAAIAVAQELPDAGTRRCSTARSSGRSSRPTAPGRSIAHSGVLPHLPQLDGTDTPPLLRLVPRRRARPARPSLRPVPRLVRFVSEFGAQAVPDSGRLHASPSAGPTSTGSDLAARPRACRRTTSTGTCRPADSPLRRVARRDPGLPGRR